MMQHNKVTVDGCEKDLKESFIQNSSFTLPSVVSKPIQISFLCETQKEDFNELYWLFSPPCSYNERGLRFQEASKRMQLY